MSNISAEKYRDIIRYIIALEEAEDVSRAIIALLHSVIDFDAAMYVRISKDGMYMEHQFVAENEKFDCFDSKEFCLTDPVFDMKGRASGFSRTEAGVYDVSFAEDARDQMYHDILERKGVKSYAVIPIGKNGSGVRIYRSENYPFFSAEEIDICSYLAIILKRVLPRRREMEKRLDESFLGNIIPKMLAFGALLYDKELNLLRCNTLALTRIGEITNKRDHRAMLEEFKHMVENQVDGLKKSGGDMNHDNVDDRYIIEVVKKEELDDKDQLATYYCVNIYSADWFRAYLSTSTESTLEKYKLTIREMEIAEQLLKGLSTKEIAAHLNISIYTAKEHLKNIFRKMDVKSRSEMITKTYLGKK